MPPAITPGTTIERYRIEAVVGAGSMGDVYRGIDIDLKRKVAIKILSERHRDNQELRARFVREARAAAAISHPNVVQVFAIGSFDDRPYIAMEFLEGADLGTLVSRQGPWTSLAAAQAVRDTARGLQAAARAGLIHRDVKPTNLVMLQDGLVKVTDFGLAKPMDTGGEPALTAMGVVVGTPDYIAPEQARGDTIDHRVDIYALGGTLYYLLAAMPPFRTGRPADDKYLKVVARHLRDPAPDARARNPEADPELTALARAMMAKRADQRPTYDDLLMQLDGMVARLQRGGRQRPPSLPAPTDGSGGQVGPTPFVGGAGPVGAALDAAGGGNAGPPAVMPRAPAHGGARADTSVIVAPALPRWLLGVTVVSVLLLLAGVGLAVLGPASGHGAGEESGGVPATAADAGPAPGDPGQGVAPAALPASRPTPPEGMLLVTRADGTPWLFVDAAPVTEEAYAAIFPNHRLHHKSRRKAAASRDKAVTGVAFVYAQAYARSRGKRLLTAEEWQAAARVQGFDNAGGLWEWVADDADDGQEHPAAQQVIHAERGTATRGARDSDGVAFRLAADL